MFIEKFSLPTRVALLGTLGMSAWLIAFSRILNHAGDSWNNDDKLLIGLGLLNGFLMLVNTAGQLRTMLKNNMKWFTNNLDSLCWISLIGSYFSVLYIQRLWQPNTLDLFLLSFMIVIHSIHTIRFSMPVSVGVLLMPAVLYGWQAGGETGFYLALFIANQELVLLGLGLGVLRELLEAQKLKNKTGELKVAQGRLAEQSRRDERRKIRQDLHDKMGHELAAMNINLQLLEHKFPNKSAEETSTLMQAQDSCQRLFSTLGTVVGELRKQTNAQFYDQLEQMITNVPSLKIELECEPSLKIQDDIIADNLLCCIQEALTNILKHSHAKKAWVNIHYDAGDLNVSIRDNGKSNDQIKVGNGLTGIQNRMATIGGSASSEIAEQGGFQVALNLPREALI
jgi:signal transduction histidine kinase